MLLTAQLAFVIFMLAAEQHAATYLAPLGIGLSFFVAELVGKFCWNPRVSDTLTLTLSQVYSGRVDR